MRLKFFLLKIIVLLSFCSSLEAQNNNFRFIDPKAQWRSGLGLITYAEYIVRIDQNFAHCDLYLTYTANIPNFTNPKDTFEVVQYFNLPKQTLVTDSWLWVDSVIMKADILERRSAFNIYEGIVNRRQDPSILFKNSETQYEFRIFPIANKKSRRVKLSFTIPLNRVKDNLSLPLPVGLISASVTKPNILIKVKYDETYQKIINDLGFSETYDNFLGKHYKTTVLPTTYSLSPELPINIQMNQSQVIFATQKTPENDLKKNYQISFNPLLSFGLDNSEARNVVILIDHETVTSSINKQSMINNVKAFMNNTLYPTDSIQIIFTNNKANTLFNTFIPYNANTLNNFLNTITLGDISLLYSGMYDAYDLLKNKANPVLVVFSSGVSFANSSVAASAKNNLYNLFKTVPKSFFINYNNANAPGFWYQNQFYYGNNLFYNTMSSNSGGTFVSLVGNINNVSSPSAAIQRISENFEEYSLNNYEMEIRIKSADGGFSYDNTNFKNKKTGFSQTGLLVGKPPYTIEGVFYNEKDVVSKKFIIDEININDGYAHADQIHAGLNILKFETEALKTKESQIVNLSLENRVLSRFTAFLALEPNLQTPCFTCEDESNTPTATNQTQFGHQVKVFPNPFSEIIAIEIQDVKNAKIEDLSIFDSMGRKYDVAYDVKYNDDSLSITIQGGNLKSGIYFVKVKLGDKLLTFKIIKSS